MQGFTVAFALKWVALLIAALGIAYFSGVSVQKLLKLELAPAERFAAGFTADIAAVELLCWPLVAFRGSAALFCVLAGAALLSLAGYGAVHWKKERPAKPQLAAALLALAVLLTQIGMTAVLYRGDADDSFYVSNVALFAESDTLNPYDSSMGDPALGTVPMYDFQIWESLQAMAVRLFRIPAAALTHTCLLPILLIFSASACYLLGMALFRDRRKAWLFLFFLSVFHLFSGANDYSVGAFLLGRLWQGKAASLTIVLPTLTGLLLRQTEGRTRLWPSLLICMLAAVGLNPTGLYTVGFEMLFLCAAAAAAEKRPRLLLELLPALAAAALFAGMIYLRTRQYAGQISAASTADGSFVFTQLAAVMKGQWVYLGLFVLLLPLIARYGGRRARIYFLWASLLMAVCLWLPPLGLLVAEHLTKTPSYWRVFWLIPVGPALAWGAVFGSEKLGKGLFPVLLCAVLIALPGRWMFDAPADVMPFVPAVNVEKVPEETLEFGKLLAERGAAGPVLACDTLATTLRQVDTAPVLLVSRDQYTKDLYLYRGQTEAAEDRLALSAFANGGDPGAADVSALLERYGVQCVMLENSSGEAKTYLLARGWTAAAETAEYTMLMQSAGRENP